MHFVYSRCTEYRKLNTNSFCLNGKLLIYRFIGVFPRAEVKFTRIFFLAPESTKFRTKKNKLTDILRKLTTFPCQQLPAFHPKTLDFSSKFVAMMCVRCMTDIKLCTTTFGSIELQIDCVNRFKYKFPCTPGHQIAAVWYARAIVM